LQHQTQPSRNARESQARSAIPQPVSFRLDRNQGLIVNAWVNGSGPFSFAVDTGAGTTIVSRRVATEGSVVVSERQESIGGVSGAGPISGSAGTLRRLALGDPGNIVSVTHRAIVTDRLPQGIDGILDPTEAYAPFGYSVDLPHYRLEAFDPAREPLALSQAPPGGTVVRWLTDSESRRPYVRLGDGRLVLLDTGSTFGLAISGDPNAAHVRGHSARKDIGGGRIESRRVQPTTVTIGALTLRGVPTDILWGVEADAPVLLGRDALRPFKLIFDPVHRLVAIQPAE